MTPAEFDALLMRCLDERRDPFLDAELAVHLAQDPEAAVRTAELLARLEVVATAPVLRAVPTPQRRRVATRVRLAVLAIAAIATLAAVGVLAGRGPSTPATGTATQQAPGQVLRATLRPIRDHARTTSVTVRTVLAAERGLTLQTFDRRVVHP